MLKIRRTGTTPVMDIIKTENADGSELLYMQIPAIRATGIVEHAFSTRIGGTSQGIFSSMNLRFGHGDEDARVRENIHRMASVLGTDEAHMVLTKQTHTTNVRVVTAADAGYGVVRERPYDDVDGLITDVPGLALGIFAADCVPLLFVDPVHHVIGASHSGWRGTAMGIAAKAVAAMCREFGCDPAGIRAAIGPCIGLCCFEVGPEVPEAMRNALGADAEPFFEPRGEKYHVDLKGLNRLWLERAGLSEIDVCPDCTKCQPERFWSHRAVGNQRGSQAAIIMRKE